MARTPYILRVRARISELERAIQQASKELEELRIAERVLSRMGGEDGQPEINDGGLAGSTKPPRTQKRLTVPLMVLRVLAESGPMDTHSLLAAIQDRFRPDLTFPTVSSTLSRMKKAGQIESDGRCWSVRQSDGNLSLQAISSGEPIGAQEGSSSNAHRSQSDI